MNTAVKGFTAFQINVHVLTVRGDIGDNKDLSITGLTVKVTAWEKKRITVQVVEHIAMFQTAPEFLKDDNVLSIVGVKRVLVIGDTVTTAIAVFVHDGAGFAGTSFTEHVCNGQVTPGGGKLHITEQGSGTLHLVDDFHSAGNRFNDFQIVGPSFSNSKILSDSRDFP